MSAGAQPRIVAAIAAGTEAPALLERRIDRFAPEIAFLAGQGVPPDTLLRAMENAREVGVTADVALLGLGFAEDRFYRLLARHLGVPFLDRPLPLAVPADDQRGGARLGFEPLLPNFRRLRAVVAPEGVVLRALLSVVRPGDGSAPDFAIVAPRRLRALVRRRDRASLLHRASNGLADWDDTLSARGGPTRAQALVALACAAAFALAFACDAASATTCAGLATCVLFLWAILFRLAATAAGRRAPEPDRGARAPDRTLPVYTVVVPLLREARVVPDLVRALDALDYPRAKLDIKLMVEAGDRDTLAALEALALASRYEIIVAPFADPRTKPRALNLALAHAKGEFLVVYDAEDRPDPAQLRAAVAMFGGCGRHMACLQAALLIDHADETWLTRMFALDYAGLFGVVLPGLAALGLPMPLGGTSNHFRVGALQHVGGWDAWNVTEDIDLGYRLARLGFKVGTLPSTTFEEAPLTLRAWLPQRRRWLKGWMMTAVVVARQPGRLFRELGFWSAASIASSLFGTIAGGLFGPLFLAVVAARAMRGTLFHPATALDVLWSTLSVVVLAFGPASALWPHVLGARKTGRPGLLLALPGMPLYLMLVSVAAWLALVDVVRRPYRWSKTEHGLAQKRV